MKKKLLLVALATAMTFSLVACGESEKKIENNTNNSVEEKGEDQGNQTSANDFVFKFKGADVVIGAEAAAILEKIGEPLSQYESPSCAFGDLDVMYTYSGVEIDTYQDNKVDYISAIIVLDDSVSTAEGLSIGDDVAKVTEVYGEPTSDENGSMIYKRDNMKLMVVVESGKVSSIQYLNTLGE